ncbi:MAG: POTRA domain-containing protein [Candidatus Aminicenantes bacterium]|jgi:outer membrane protein assembly factor BamA
MKGGLSPLPSFFLNKKLKNFLFVSSLILPVFLHSENRKIHIRGLVHIREEDVLSVIQKKLKTLKSDEIESILEKSLMDLGWFSDVEVDRKKSETLCIQVKEYPVVRKIHIRGNTLYPDSKVIDKLELESGRVFNRVVFYQNLQKLYDFYKGKGYTQVEVAQVDIKPDGELVLSVVEWRIKDIIFPPDIRTKKKILLSFLIPGGDQIYNSLELKKRLEELNYTEAFNAINISVEKSEEKGYLNLNAFIEEKKPRLKVRLRYNSFGGLNGRLGIVNKNLFGRLEEFELSDTFYHMNQSYSHQISASWNPVLRRKKELFLSFALSANIWKRKFFKDPDIRDLDIFSWEASAGLVKSLNPFFSYGFGLKVNHWDLQKPQQTGAEGFNFAQGLFLKPHVHLRYQNEDRLKRKGFFAQCGLDVLLGNNSPGTRWTLSGHHYFTFSNNYRLSLDIGGGILHSKKPPFLYFFWIGHQELIPYFRYEEMAFDKFGKMSAKLDFPYLFHFIRISPYVSVLTAFQQSPILGRGRLIFGLEFRLSFFGIPLYLNWSLLDNTPLKSSRFSVYVR